MFVTVDLKVPVVCRTDFAGLVALYELDGLGFGVPELDAYIGVL